VPGIAYRRNLDMKQLPSIKIYENRLIGDDQPCFIVAEVGQNHNGSMSMARELLDNIAFHKADAAKFCKRHIPSDLTHEASARAYPGPQSFGETYGKHREALELSKGQYSELKSYAEGKGLIFFATACDQKSVDDLEEIGVRLYKVASRDLTNLPLLDYMARTGKPVILSSGMNSMEEIGEALDAIRRHHDRIVLLQCTSSYPTPHEDVNMRVVHTLRREFDVLTGMSDHTVGVMVPVVAAALGAVVVEKHVTLARHLKGTDHACSLEPEGLRRVVRDIRAMELALGDGVKRVPASVAAASDKLSRALVSTQRIPKGTVLTEEMVCLKSPGTGIKWRERRMVIGRRAKRDIPEDITLTPEDFE
jgi:sialic acid synthase SpsE